MNKILPKMTTDEEVESLLEGDLSEYLNTDNFKPVTFEFAPKTKTVSIRMSEEMLTAVKSAAQKQGIPYQRYIRQTIERALGE